ncbi:MAG: hypothetical protein ACK45U_03400, partial [bacterium]
MRKFWAIIGISSVLYSCNSKEVVTLPEITVETKKEIHSTPRRYYSTYTRKADLIHTKLDIQLNWDSCFVITKANLKVKPYFYS